MKPYEAQFLPLDMEYVPPAHSETSDIAQGTDYFTELTQKLAEHHTGKEGDEAVFTFKEEAALFKSMREGREVQCRVESLPSGSGERLAAEQAVTEGNQARQKIIEVTARFVCYIAQASRGAKTARLTYAEVDDRMQDGIVDMITAVDEYKSRRVRPTALRKVYGVADLSSIGVSDVDPQTEHERLQGLHDTYGAPNHVSWDEISFPYAASEEAADYESTEPDALHPSEVYPDRDSMRPFEAVETRDFRRVFREIFSKLTEREAVIASLYYGLTDDDKQLTQPQISEVYGLSDTRVYQILGKAKAKLRYPNRRNRLEDWRDIVEDGTAMTPFFTGDRLRTERMQARESAVTERTSAAPQPSTYVPNWVEYVLEGIKDIPEPVDYSERLERGTGPYDRVYQAFVESIEENLRMLDVLDSQVRSSPVPYELYRDIEELLGNRLNPKHIQDFWNNHAASYITPYLNKSHAVNFDRLGQLMSLLLSTRMTEADRIHLTIPNWLQGQCGYLGAWARKGDIIIVGDAGDYVGAHMQGTAVVEVTGSVGNYAGYAARDQTRLYASKAGAFLGAKARGNSLIVAYGTVGESAGAGISEQAIVKSNVSTWRAPLHGEVAVGQVANSLNSTTDQFGDATDPSA